MRINIIDGNVSNELTNYIGRIAMNKRFPYIFGYMNIFLQNTDKSPWPNIYVLPEVTMKGKTQCWAYINRDLI